MGMNEKEIAKDALLAKIKEKIMEEDTRITEREYKNGQSDFTDGVHYAYGQVLALLDKYMK